MFLRPLNPYGMAVATWNKIGYGHEEFLAFYAKALDRVLEINPRFGGGFPLSAAAGGAYCGWLIDWIRGEDAEIAMDGFQDRLLMLRWDEAVFVPESSVL